MGTILGEGRGATIGIGCWIYVPIVQDVRHVGPYHDEPCTHFTYSFTGNGQILLMLFHGKRLYHVWLSIPRDG